jgi:hypothetical protein
VVKALCSTVIFQVVLSACDSQCGEGAKFHDKGFWLYAFDLFLEDLKEDLVLSAHISCLMRSSILWLSAKERLDVIFW